MTTQRRSEASRQTAETSVTTAINLDGTGSAELHTGIGFFDHMLEQIARHGLIDLRVHCQGDLHVDGHHTVEDVGITLGQAFARALGDKKGIRRYGHAYVPLDEALSRVVIDFSGRPGLVLNIPFASAMVGSFDTQLTQEFFQGFVTPLPPSTSTPCAASTPTTRLNPSLKPLAAPCAWRLKSTRVPPTALHPPKVACK